MQPHLIPILTLRSTVFCRDSSTNYRVVQQLNSAAHTISTALIPFIISWETQWWCGEAAQFLVLVSGRSADGGRTVPHITYIPLYISYFDQSHLATL